MRNIEEIYPLSPLQTGLLFHTLYESNSNVYVEQISCRIKGPLNVTAFRNAWQAVVDRHAILRTSFLWEKLAAPIQVVRRSVQISWDERDWRGKTDKEQQAELTAFEQENRQRGFDLRQMPLMRFALFQLAEQTYQFVWSNHHIILDGWSRAQVLKEVFAFYEAEQQGRQITLAPPHLYREYIAWLQQQDQADAERFWRQILGERTGPTSLGIENEDAAKLHAGGAESSLSLVLPQEITLALQRLAREQKVTMNTLVQAAWALLLSRYSREREVVYGMTVAGRPTDLPGIEQMVGLFINTVPVCLEVPGEVTVGDWVQQVQQQLLDLQSYEYCSLSQIQGWSGVPHGVPLFESLVVFENYPVDAAVRDGVRDLTVEQMHAEQQISYPLTLIASFSGQLRLRLSYNCERFEATVIHRLLGHLRTLLEGIATHPTLPLSELAILSPAELEQLLSITASAGLEYAQDMCLSALFEEQVKRTPDAVALVCEEEQISYAEVEWRANQTAHLLRQYGVGSEVRVGLCLERSLYQVIGVLAILKAGGAYVPLDPYYPEERLAFICKDADLQVILTEEEHQQRLQALAVPLLVVDMAHSVEIEPVYSDAQVDNAAYLIYTSGSTGTPKGVVVSHRNVGRLFAASWDLLDLEPQETWTLFHSLAFDFSVWELWGALLHGGRLVVVPYWVSRSPERFYDLLVRERVTILNQTPSAFFTLAQVDEQAGDAAAWLRLRLVIFGGEALEMGRMRGWGCRHGYRQPRLVNMYGITETTVHVTQYVLEEEIVEAGRTSVIGRPLTDLQVYVLDNALQPLPRGVIGEMYVGGAGVARGYLGRSELTAERFVPDPFGRVPGGRLYRTGDLGRWNESGMLEYVGRQDQQVKVRGYRIELGEIEAVLQRHASVQAVVMQARADGENGQKRLVAYLVARDASTLDTNALREYARLHLPEYMLPAAYVLLDALPLTPNGKLDRRALPAPDASQRLLSSAKVAPQNEVQQQLVQIWQQVLGVEQVGITDNFFALGGDSILSIQIVARAGQVGLRLTPKQVFEAQTIADLARLVAEQETAVVVREAARGQAPLTPIQRRFFAQDRRHPEHYNQAILLRWVGALDVGLLEEVLTGLSEQHESLRLRFEQQAHGWQQWYCDEENIVLHEVDLSGLPVWERSAALEQAAGQVQSSLSLGKGPVWRAVLFRLGEQEAPRLLLVLHHLAVDGVSWRILLEDLRQGYEQRERGEALAWPVRSSSYQQWGQALQAYASSAALSAQLPYWQQVNQGVVGRVPVLGERDTIAQRNTVVSTRSVQVHLEREETRALLQEVPGVYHTHINEVLLTALGLSLAVWTGERRWRIALEGHGREQEVVGEDLDISRTVGWFTSLYPLIVDLEGNEDLGRVLKEVKEQVRQVPQAGLGYGALRYLAGHEELAEDGEISFNYLGQVDGTLEAAARRWEIAQEAVGPAQESGGTRPYLLDISAIVREGRLQVSWRYSEALQTQEQIEQVAEQFLDQLRAIIAHCQWPEVGGFTPSDFPLARLTQSQLERMEQQGPVEDLYALSPMQQGMLFHTLYAMAGSGVYINQISCRLQGPLDSAAFQRAWQSVLNRHAILRTGFVWEGLDEPVQVVRPALPCPWNERDWRTLSEQEQQESLNVFSRDERAWGFALDQAPLMRLTLFRLAEQTYHFIWTHHLLLLDGWSLAQVLKEVFAAYEAEHQGRQMSVATLYPYREYIAWLQKQDLAKAESFWRQQLQDISSPTPLGIDRVGFITSSGGEVALERRLIAEETVIALQRMAREHQLTLNTLIQGAWALLLSRYSGERDVVYGTTVSGRPADLAGVETIVGSFINALPVRVHIAPQVSLLVWLGQLQAQLVDLRQYEYTPLVQLQGWSQVPRGTPLFESVVIFENYPVDASAREGLREIQIQQMQGREQNNCPLTLVVTASRTMQLRLSYACERFELSAIQNLLDHFQYLLQQLVAEPEQNLEQMQLLTPAERQRMLAANDAMHIAAQPEKPLHRLFEEQVEYRPEAIALALGNEQYSYSAVNMLSNHLSHAFLSLKKAEMRPVVLLTSPGVPAVLAMLATLKAGLPFVCLDVSAPLPRLRQQLSECEPLCLVLAEADYSTYAHLCAWLKQTYDSSIMLLDDSLRRGTFFRLEGSTPDWSSLTKQAASNPQVPVDMQSSAYIAYTSGSTGVPKGIIQSHRSFCQFLNWFGEQFAVKPSKRVAQWAALTFDASYVELFVALVRGATVAIVPGEIRADAGELLAWTDREQPTLLQLVPSMLRSLLDVLEVNTTHEAYRPLRALEYVPVAGEVLSVDLARTALKHFHGQTQLVNLYGPTESVLATYHVVSDVQVDQSQIPIGKAIPGRQVLVLDQFQHLCPPGIIGEIYIRSPYLSSGYFQHDAETRRVFQPVQAGDSVLAYRTGDLGCYLENGELDFRGRRDNQVKIRGMRVELEEIETVLARYTGITACAVAAHGSEQEGKSISAYIVPNRGVNVAASTPGQVGNEHYSSPVITEIRAYLRANLPEYMQPGWIIPLDALPLTANGKVNRQALPVPDPEHMEREDPFVAPASVTEQTVAEIWREVLRLQRVGVHDNFFALGGHSLLATQVVSRIQSTFQMQLSLRTFFESPTVAGLSRAVETARKTEPTHTEKIDQLVTQIQELSDDEVRALLARKRLKG